MKMFWIYFGTFAVVATLYACNHAKARLAAKEKLAVNDSSGIRFQMITDALTAPVQMVIPPDNSHRRFIADNMGKIWIMKGDSLLKKPFLDISTKPVQQTKPPLLGTIFGMAFHPKFAMNKKFYVCYNGATNIHANKTKLVVAEFTVTKENPDEADVKSGHHVFELEGSTVYGNGAEIAFGPDSYLYISIGDDSAGDTTYKHLAQNLNFLNGKLLRIDVNKTPYAIPPDNPFVGIKNQRSEIWAYGFRKLWRFSFDPKSHQVFGADVGQEKQEEIDIISKGANYGWPIMEGDSVYQKINSIDKTSFTSPINAYARKDGICIIGGSFYYGKDIPLLNNKYVFADFNGNMFALMKSEPGEWVRQQLKVLNKPTDPFLICGCDADENKELYVMGILKTKNGSKGAVYKLIKE